MPDRAAERDADRIRLETWGAEVPVDPARIAHTLGVRVLDAELEPDLSGALVKRRGDDPYIVLNARDGANRRRFTCAHELGHYVRRRENPEEYDYVDRRDAFSGTGVGAEERYANAFAASLLMPEPAVRERHRRGWTDVSMAALFGVSREAMVNRLKNLGLM